MLYVLIIFFIVPAIILIFSSIIAIFAGKGVKIRVISVFLIIVTLSVLFQSILPLAKEEFEKVKAEASFKPENIILEVTDMEAISDQKFLFDIKITNNTLSRINACEIEMIATNSKGEKLISTTITDFNCDPDSSKNYELTVRTSYDDYVTELLYTDFDYLNIQIKIISLTHAISFDPYPYSDTVRTLHTADTAKLQSEYERACSLMDEENYEEAYNIFCTLGYYSDSNEKREFCYEQMYSSYYW